MLETPVTSAPIVAAYLSALPAYRTGVAPLLRGVEIGLAHGFLLTGPFIKVHTPDRHTFRNFACALRAPRWGMITIMPDHKQFGRILAEIASGTRSLSR